MPESVRIVHLVPELVPGGATRSLFELLSRLDPQLFSITVLSTGRSSSGLRRRFAAAGLRTVHLPLPVSTPGGPGARWNDRWHALGALRAHLHSTRPRIVHAHGPAHNFLGVLAARLAGVPHIMTHDHRVPGGGWRRQLAANLSAPFVDIAFVDSEAAGAARRALLWSGADSILHLSMGVDLQRFRPPTPAERHAAREGLDLPPDACCVGTTARSAPGEPHAVLLEAFLFVVGQVPNAYLLLPGTGDEDYERLARARRLGIGARVRVVAGRRRAACWALDAFVTPGAAGAGPGRRLAEAMACGLPVVTRFDLPTGTTPAGGVVHRTAFDPEALGASLVHLARSEPERTRLSAAARKYAVLHLDVDASAQVLEAVYAHCVARTPRPWACRKELIPTP